LRNYATQKALLQRKARDLTTPDIPHLRYALARQRALIETCYLKLGQQRGLIHRLSLDNAALKAIIDDQDDPSVWDDDGDRR
jgi:hypothetical protein